MAFKAGLRARCDDSRNANRREDRMSMHSRLGKGLAAGLVAAGMALGAGAAVAQEKVRVALGDVVSEETLAFIVALERAKERGVDYELTSFAEEELAIQAIVGGQIGSRHRHALRGDPEGEGAAPRHLPDVGARLLPGRLDRIQDLEGPERPALHLQLPRLGDRSLRRRRWRRAKGSSSASAPTSPGSGNRVIALLNGTIKATILDLSNKNKVLEQAPDKFHVLPGVEEKVSDEILFANADWLAANKETGDDRRRGAAEALARDERRTRHHRGGAREAQPARRPAGGSHRGGPGLLRGRRRGRHLESGRRQRGDRQGRLRLLRRRRPARRARPTA